MTDKELKKLSRLELLELLLATSNENQELKQKIEKLTSENEASRSIEDLVRATKQTRDTLDYANKLISFMESKKNYKDWKLYLRLMNFYLKNQEALGALSPELRNAVVNRLKEIIEKRKNS